LTLREARSVLTVCLRCPPAAKQGKFMPGSHIKKRPHPGANSRQCWPNSVRDYLLILPWNIAPRSAQNAGWQRRYEMSSRRAPEWRRHDQRRFAYGRNWFCRTPSGASLGRDVLGSRGGSEEIKASSKLWNFIEKIVDDHRPVCRGSALGGPMFAKGTTLVTCRMVC